MTTPHKSIQNQVLKKIQPTEEERKILFKTIDSLIQKVSQEITKQKISATIEIVGSTAKDTFLQNNLDIDLFLLFSPTTTREQLEKQGLLIGKNILKKQEECYAEHPYIRGYYQGYKTEIVPCYKIGSASQKLSAVDRTPLHTRYIKEHLKEKQKQEVRLLKQFLKGIGCYGAEAEIEGFSGYLCEILILKYKTFNNLLIKAKNWKNGEKLTLTKKTITHFETPLTFIDPVDSTRNVSSAVSMEKYTLFIKACKAYIKKPSITFFYPKPIKPWSLKKISTMITTKKYIGITFPKPQIIPENLYPQIRKAVRSITELCEHYDFHIHDATFFIEKNTIYIILQPEQEVLQGSIIHEGPPCHLKKHVNEFLKKWENNKKTTRKPYEKNNKMYVEIKREYTTLKKLLCDQLHKQSLGKHIDEIIQQNTYTIIDTNKLVIEKLRSYWTVYLSQKDPWE